MLPLEGLYTILEKENFSISLDTRLRVEKVLLSRDATFLKDPKDLKFVLAPLIAKSQREQEKFYRIFDTYYNELIREQPKILDPTQRDPKIGDPIAPKRRWFYLLDVLLLLLLIDLFIPHPPGKPKTYFEVNRPLTDYNIESTRRLLLNKTPNKEELTFKWWIALDNERNLVDSIYTTRPPDTIVNNEIFNYEFGISGTYRVILNASNSSGLDSTYSRMVSIKDVTAPLAMLIPLPQREPVRIDSSDNNYVFTYKFQKYLLFGLLLIWFLWELVAFMRIKGYFFSRQIKEEFTAGDAPPYYLPFQSKDHHIDIDSRMYDIANHMRRRRVGKASQLDLQDSIKKTISKGGFPQLVYREKSKPSEYLILIDQVARRNHSSQLFSFLVEFLVSEDVYIAYYYFDSDPRTCWNEYYPEGVSLSYLTNKYSDHRLVIFSNGSEWVDEVFEPKLKDWVKKSFRTWKDKAVVTTTPFAKWNYVEEFLAEQFSVVPASLNGQLHLVNQMMHPNLEDAYMATEKQPVLSHFNHENVEQLKGFFTEEEFAWLCTLALHQELVWEVTLSLGQTVEEFYQDSQNKSINILNYTSLLKLSSLAWIENDAMPDHLRMSLVKEIEKNEKLEKLARSKILQVLEEIEKDAFSSREKNIGIAIQSVSLNKRDRQSWRTVRYLWHHNMLDRSHQNAFQKYFRIRPSKVLQRAAIMLFLCPMIFYNPSVRGYHQDIIQSPVFQNTLENKSLAKINNFNSLAYYNNRGVDMFYMASYDSARINFQRAEKIAIGQKSNNTIPSYNLKMITYKQGVNLYRNYLFTRSIDSFSRLVGKDRYSLPLGIKDTLSLTLLTNKDSLLLDVYNNIAVNYAYFSDTKARRIRDLIGFSDASYFNRVVPNIQTLLDNKDEFNPRDLQGYWKGVLYEGLGVSESGRARPKYYFDLILRRSDFYDFTGTSQMRWLDDDQAFFITPFSATYYDYNVLSIYEEYNPKEYKGYSSLSKIMYLRPYTNRDGKFILVGEWHKDLDDINLDNRIILSKVSNDTIRR
jgi:hypothetical protein